METARNIVGNYLTESLFNTVAGMNGRYAQFQGGDFNGDTRTIGLYSELGYFVKYAALDEALDYIGLEIRGE